MRWIFAYFLRKTSFEDVQYNKQLGLYKEVFAVGEKLTIGNIISNYYSIEQ